MERISMSQYDHDEDEFDGNGTEENLPEPARKRLRDLEKELKTLRKERDDDRKNLNDYRLRDVLKERGITDKRVSKFIQKDEVDLSDNSAVDAWLDENGDLFGYTKQEAAADEQDAATLAQMNEAESAGKPVGTAEAAFIASLQNAKSSEELTAILQSANR